ncbi:hypothetical protein SBRCBS47491_009201 [Sporothrix bragantina]|uniref:Isotrichodermin C-15 hydroxylase n=1 Tax=Sporothrix bragantina TaxID=671064 RepID=A0ABP0CTP1_9PEZI
MAWMSGAGHKKIFELHQKYGDIVRISPNQLSFSYPEAWNDIMGHRKRGQDENGKDPDFWRGDDNLTLVGSNRERHSRLRKIMSHGFSAQAMNEQQPVFQKYADLLVTQLRNSVTDGDAVDITKWYNWATFDMAGDLIFGEPFGCLETEQYHPWVKLIFMHIKGISISTALIRYPFAEAIIKFMTPKSVAKDIQSHHEFTQAQVKKRISYENPRPDFMESMIKAHKNGDVSMREMLANAHNLIVGGSETTATTLAYAEMRLILAKMIWNFNMELDARSKGWLEKNVVYLLWEKPELFIRLTPRMA